MSGRVLNLGVVEYGRALEFQRELAARRARDEVSDTLILLEHPHVITLGRKTSPENFRPQGVPVFTVERGGDATYHGPGQLVGYPVVKLVDHDVRKHVKTIEKALISAVGRFGIESSLVEGHPGIWAGGKKLASIGVAVKDWVTYHGFALNVNTDLSYFGLIRPCGLDPNTMTSMEKQLGKRLDMDAVKRVVAEEFSSAAGRQFVRHEFVREPLGVNVN
jgi:lipoate-protein ligase B